MNTRETCVVFEPDATILAVVDVARANHWKEVQRIKRGERRLEEVIYECADGETIVRGIDDHFVVIVFASITGPNRDEVEKKLRAAGRALDDTTLFRWAKSDDAAERSFALRAFAAISTETADPGVVALYTEALEDHEPQVRSALIESVGRTAWKELWPVVEELAASGASDAKALKESYERNLGPNPTAT